MQDPVSEEAIIRFGEFELALKSCELRHNGSIVRLQPQPFRVLAFLATHAGQTVTRRELQQAVWNGETFVDFEHGLNFCIKQIRNALGDDAQSPRLIETLPRRGYRFIARVEKLNGSTVIQSDSEAPVAPPEADQAAERKRLRLFKSSIGQRALIVAIVAAVLVTNYIVLRRTAGPAPPKARLMIVVLPFENLSGDPEQAYFSDGMTEEMIAQLGRLKPGGSES